MDSLIIGLIIIIVIIIIYEIVIHIVVKEVPTITEPSDTSNSSIKISIPRIIHRTWYSKTLTKKMYDLSFASWINLNPTYYMIWNDDENCKEFMKSIGEKEYNAWDKIIPTAYKADFWRAIKLYETGGVYVDSYAVAVKSIDDIIERSGLKNEKDIFISVLDCQEASSGIHNGLLICTPKHPLMLQYINDMLDNIKNGSEDQIMALTGPICLSRSINKYLGRDINTKHQVGLNIINDKKYYLLQFYFGPYGYINIGDEVMLYKKYDILDCWIHQKLYKSLIGSSQSYSAMNKIGKIVKE